jgi:hypothetical protein
MAIRSSGTTEPASSEIARTNHACRYSILHTTFSSYPAQPSSINMPCALENSETHPQAFVEAGETEHNKQKNKDEKPGEQLVHHSGRQQRLLISQELGNRSVDSTDRSQAN